MMFARGEEIPGGYKVVFPIKDALNAETYRVKSENGELLFLKLFHPERLDPERFTEQCELREIDIYKGLRVDRVPQIVKSGSLELKDGTVPFLLTKFIFGETLEDRLRRTQTLDSIDAELVIKNLAVTVQCLHESDRPVIHNEVAPENILLDPVANGNDRVWLIDFGHAQHTDEAELRFPGTNPYFVATESFSGEFSERSDIFSLGATLYNMLFGIAPWSLGISQYKASRYDIKDELAKSRKKPLPFPSILAESQVSAKLLAILQKALSDNPGNRYQSVGEFLQALEHGEKSSPSVGKVRHAKIKVGPRGFDAIAGMESLKRTLIEEVVGAIRNPERYERFGLSIPNGMLLYGPPGCGKTFIAERFAEEADIPFYSIKPSDLASIYVHGTQEKIGKLFEEARSRAPVVLFLDELDAMLPARTESLHQGVGGEVNEFLTQMSNAGDEGIFIIGATNRPTLIDPAVMRAGRMDKVIYVGPPDFEARKAMLNLHLDNRPLVGEIDTDQLAELTSGTVASDLRLIVDSAARKAMFADEEISMAILLSVVREFRPTVAKSEISKYDAIRNRMENGQETTRSIGFKIRRDEQ